MPAIKSSNPADGADSDDNMSIDNGGDSSSRAADSSAEDESDDSEDMDEAEVCPGRPGALQHVLTLSPYPQVERRRNDCLDNLANLEKQFAILRDQLYQEKVNHVEMQMADLHGGRSQVRPPVIH